MMIHKVSLDHAAARSPTRRGSQAMPGVELVTHNTWFGGIYQDPTNFFAQIAVEPGDVSWRSTRVQAAAGADEGLARRPAGRDRRPATSPSGSAGRSATASRSRRPSGSRRTAARPGSSTSSASTTATQASTRRSSSSATTTSTRTARSGEGMVGWYIVKIDDPSQSAEMAADASTRCSPTRRPRPRPRPRRASSRASPNRSATSARS